MYFKILLLFTDRGLQTGWPTSWKKQTDASLPTREVVQIVWRKFPVYAYLGYLPSKTMWTIAPDISWLQAASSHGQLTPVRNSPSEIPGVKWTLRFLEQKEIQKLLRTKRRGYPWLGSNWHGNELLVGSPKLLGQPCVPTHSEYKKVEMLSLEQRNVYFRAMQGDGWLIAPKPPNFLKGFSKAFLNPD